MNENRNTAALVSHSHNTIDGSPSVMQKVKANSIMMERGSAKA